MGGYLIVCPLGRPIEFHCTEVVTPTRAQQILFGPTLDAYLRGEVIGATLVRSAAHKPAALLIDDGVLGIAGRLTDTPTVRLGDEPAEQLATLERLALAIDLDEPFARIREAIAETQRFEAGEQRHAA